MDTHVPSPVAPCWRPLSGGRIPDCHQTFVPYDARVRSTILDARDRNGEKERRMDFSAMGQVAVAMITQVGLRMLGAIILWAIGRMIISVIVRLVSRSLALHHVDATITRYLGNILAVILNIGLALAILSLFGVETTTFAALIAAAGVAIGVAWGGLLSSFAA